MSRIVSRSEQEPLMRLQRPSSASSQDTAHLVNACLRHFLDNSSTPIPMLDRSRVDNLRVSSAEQHDGYHKRYVELLKTVYDEHHRRISEVDQVEKHLIMAKAASLAAEEKALSTLDQQLGLPKGPCQFPQHLDEALLQQHHLLAPSSYLIMSRPPVAAPQPPSTPSYLKPTFTSDQHSRVTYEEYSTTRKATSQASVSSVTQSSIRKASHKSQTMSLGFPATVKATEEVAEKTVGEAGGFVPNPSRVIFTDYVPGQTYTASLQLTNSSGTSRQISITQPSTGYFSVRVDTFPTSEGSLAPGISCTYLVSFSPDSIATFDDHVKVVSHEGVCLTVPLLGRRPQPLLEVSSLPMWYSHPGVTSDNTITCCNTGTGSGSYTIEHKEGDESDDSHFTLSTTQFDLDPGGEISVKVAFYSDSAGEFTYPVVISCNNGDVMELTLIGCCEEARVGVAGVRPVTSQHEVEQWSEGAPPTTTSNNDYLSSNDEQVIFDSVNPYQNGYQVVNIRNYCHMELPYHWSVYRPIIGPTSQPVPSLHSPYSITPHSGTLAADSTTAFLLTFTPLQPGHFTDDAHFILDDHEATQATPSIQLYLAGTCDEYDVILSPSCMVIPGNIECGIDHCHRIKLINNSVSSVYYQWQDVYLENVHIKIDPSEGHIVPDGVGHCEVIVKPLLAGDLMVDLQCIILHRGQPLVMCVRASAQAQALILDLPSLNYGLIANGTAKTLQLPVRNDAEIPIKFQLHEIVTPNQQGCLFCVPSDGEVPAHGTVVCSVKCDTSHKPLGKIETHASIRATLLCTTELGAESCVQVLAEVQSPKVCLRSCDLHVNDAYVNIPTDHVITLHNMTMVPARFNWKEQLFGDGANHCSVHITPSHGLLSPRSSCDLTVTVVWTTEGKDLPAAIMCCEVDDMKEPVLLSITGHVHGLTIHYSVVNGPDDQECQLDFGSANPLGMAPHSLYLKVTNDTAIPTTLVAMVTHFPSGLTKVDQSMESNDNTLLNVTMNIADPKSMSDKTSKSVLASQLLSKERGCSFVVTPSELDIPAYSCHVIQVTAYSDMWGVYTDQLVCQVQGLAPVSIPISYGVVGCPILFPTTATYGATTVRFGSHPADSGLVRRTIRLKNTSPCEITMDWEVYNIARDDKQLIDLTVVVGRPFPITDSSQSHDDDDVIDDDVMNESCDLVKVMIKAHEGAISSYPITINPHQTVIKGYSSASVEVTFSPTIMKTKDGCISSYILGHMSVTSEHDYYSGAVRAEGYDINPIRINVTGKSLYPRLSVQCDNDDGRDDEVVFQFTADKLLSSGGEVRSFYYARCCVNLNNSTDMKLTFDLMTHPPFSCDLAVTPPMTLIPSHSAQVCIGYELTLDDVLKCSKSKSCDPPVVTNTKQLTIKYSTGVEQLLSLMSRVFLPVIHADVEHLVFGACLLDQPASKLVTVYNDSNCMSQWSLSVKYTKDFSGNSVTEEYSNDQFSYTGVFTVAPISGITHPRQSTIITVTFTPTKEVKYAAVVSVNGALGDHVTFSVSGNGSADEATLL